MLTLSQFFETDVLILVYPQYKISMTLNIPQIDTLRAKQNWTVSCSAATTELTAVMLPS